MITKYRYTYQTQTIETLDLSSIPNGVSYQTIVITDAEIKAIEDAKIQAQKTAEANQKQKELAEQISLNKLITEQQLVTDPTTNLQNQNIFPFWDGNSKVYALDIKIQAFDVDNNVLLYKCVQAHTSQSGWIPYTVPALWTKVTPAGEVYVWVQPTGAQDAYNVDDIVWFPTVNSVKYKSLINANVYSPIAYPAGWQVVP